MSPQHTFSISNSLIITTKNKELALFGNTLTEMQGKLVSFFDAFERGGINGQDGIIETFFSRDSPLTPELLNDFERFKNRFNDTQLSAEALAEQMQNTDQRIVDYAKTCKNGEMTTKGFKEAVNNMSFSAKAGKIALQTLSTAGNAIIFAAIGKVIAFAADCISNWIHKTEIAKKAMNDAVSEYDTAKSRLEGINSELAEQNQKIDELLAKDKLTYAEKEQLEELQAITRELLLQQDIEENRAERASRKAASMAVDAYNKQYGEYVQPEENEGDWIKAAEADINNQLSSGFFPLSEGENDILSNISGYVRAIELKEQAQQAYEQALADGGDASWPAINFQDYVDMVDDYSRGLEDSISDLQEKQHALEDQYRKALHKRENGAEPLMPDEENIITTYESIYDILKLIYKYTNQNAWNQMEISNIFNSEGIEKTKEELAALYQSGELSSADMLEQFPRLYEAIGQSKLIADESSNVFREFFNEIAAFAESQGNWIPDAPDKPAVSLSIAQTIDQLNTRLKPSFDSLKSAYSDIFTDDGSFDRGSTDILSTCDSIKSRLDELNEAGVSIDYSSYENFARILSDSESESEDMKRAFDDLAASVTRAALTGTEDFGTMKAVLEDLGVVNNELIAFDALISNTEALKEAGLDLADAEDRQMQTFVKAMVSAENYEKALNLLRIQKLLCADEPLSTEDDIRELCRLAQAAGIASDAIWQLSNLNAAYEEISKGGNTVAMTAVRIQTDLIRQQVIDRFSRLKTEIDFNEIGGGTRAAAKAGSAAGESYIDALKDRLSGLNDVISHISDTIDGQIDLFEEQKEAAVDALEAEKEAAEEALEAEKALVQEKLDARQAEIDRIKEAADARKTELDLQKALYDLERMQNQKTVLRYSEAEGMHYVTDTGEIRSARETVTEAKENIRVAGLEKDISDMNGILDDLDRKIEESGRYYDSLIEETEKYWDSLIRGLEDYKSHWQELTGIEERAEMETALKKLGITTDDVLNMSEASLESFRKTYLGLLNEIYAGNDDMIDMLQKFGGISADALRPLSDTVSDAAGGTGNVGVASDKTALTPYDPNLDPSGFGKILQKWNAHMENIDTGMDFLRKNIMYEHSRQMKETINQISNSTSIINNRNQPGIHGNTINITCPGVTSQEVMRNVGIALDRKFSGFSHFTDQWSRT